MRKTFLNLLILCMLAFIWGNSMIPGEDSGNMSDTVLDTMNAVAAWAGLPEDSFTIYMDSDGDGIMEPSSYLVRKLAHMTEYGVFAALVWLRLESHGRKRALTAWFFSAATAGIDELIQHYSINRGSRLTDVLIDCTGAALSLLILTGMTYFTRRGKEKS